MVNRVMYTMVAPPLAASTNAKVLIPKRRIFMIVMWHLFVDEFNVNELES
jgi:hypothetical protein